MGNHNRIESALGLTNATQLFVRIATPTAYAFAAAGIAGFFVVLFNPAFFRPTRVIDPNLASQFGGFMAGLVGTIFGITGTLLLVLNLIHLRTTDAKRHVADCFFKMLDYHYQNLMNLKVASIKRTKEPDSEGRGAFVVFKLQLRELLRIVASIDKTLSLRLKAEDRIDIAYIAFYYGISRHWRKFLVDKLRMYARKERIVDLLLQKALRSKVRVDRTNQTSLSAYFRNIYNMIKHIDQASVLNTDEKKDFVRILRTQLSNPELYVLFFNIVLRFGKKWREQKYVEGYEFLTNLPLGYLEFYNQKDFFKIEYEEEELTS